MDTSISFARILKDAMMINGIDTNKELESILIEKGIQNANYRRISDYLGKKKEDLLKPTRVPPFELAKRILEILSFEIADEDLKEVLDNSRKEIKDRKGEEESEIYKERRVVTLNYGALIKDQRGLEAKNSLMLRITDLCGSEHEFSLYVNNLIKKDLREFLLKKEEMQNE